MQSILAVSLVLILQSSPEAPTIPQTKWKSDYTEKTWGLKLKSVKQARNQLPTVVSLVFEFTKDLTPEETIAVQKAFGKNAKMGESLECCFFDEDGVLFHKIGGGADGFSQIGEIQGVKGDAFRVTINGGFPSKSGSPPPPLHFLGDETKAGKISRVEFRLPVPTPLRIDAK